MNESTNSQPRKTALVAVAPQGPSDPWHTQDAQYEHLAALLAGPCRLDAHFVSSAAYFTRENIAKYDLVVIWTIHNAKADWALANIFAAVAENGTPVLSLHGGLWSVGASYGDVGRQALGCILYSACHHLEFQRFKVHFADVQHPLIRNLPEFEIDDEPYLVDILDKDAELLAYFSTSEVRKPADPNHKGTAWTITHANAPLLYARTLGKGRIVVNALGHDERALANPGYRQLVRQAVDYLLPAS